MRQRRRGTRPGETMRTSLVTVWPENDWLASEKTLEDGDIAFQVQPEYYVLEMRRMDTGKFRTRVLVAKQTGAAEIPEEVLLRLESMRKSIIEEQRKDRGRSQALARTNNTEGETE